MLLEDVHLNDLDNLGEYIKSIIDSKFSTIHLGNKNEVTEKHITRYRIKHSENSTTRVIDMEMGNEWLFDTSSENLLSNLESFRNYIINELNKDIVTLGDNHFIINSNKCIYFNKNNLEDFVSDLEYIKYSFSQEHDIDYLTIIKLVQFAKGFSTFEEVFDYLTYNGNHILKTFVNQNLFTLYNTITKLNNSYMD